MHFLGGGNGVQGGQGNGVKESRRRGSTKHHEAITQVTRKFNIGSRDRDRGCLEHSHGRVEAEVTPGIAEVFVY